MDKNEAYGILGVKPGANDRDVRRAYRAILFDLEDRGPSDPDYVVKKEQLEQAFALCLAEAQKVAPQEPIELMATAPPDPEAVKKKHAVWLVGGLFGIALIFGFYRFFQSSTEDVDGESASDTQGMIAALEATGAGSKVVVFKPDLQKVDVPGYVAGEVDKDIAWRPDGNRLLFVSNRGDGNYNVHRWDPNTGRVSLRSVGNRAKAALHFGWTDEPKERDQGLMVSGGFVFAYDQKSPEKTAQLLPPVSVRAEGGNAEESGSVSQMEELYKQIGTAFLSAKWGPKRQMVWAVMRREFDEVFLLNPLTMDVNKGRPIPVFAGKTIEFDVTPSGDAIVAVRGYDFFDPTKVPEEYLKNGKPVPPYDGALFFVSSSGGQPQLICFTQGRGLYFGTPGKGAQAVKMAPEGKMAVGQPVVSPDGHTMVFLIGEMVGESGFSGREMVVYPLDESSPVKGPRRIAEGHLSDPAFSPASDKVCYAKAEADGKRSIFVVATAGGAEERVSQGGDFFSPRFSPQKPVVPK